MKYFKSMPTKGIMRSLIVLGTSQKINEYDQEMP